MAIWNYEGWIKFKQDDSIGADFKGWIQAWGYENSGEDVFTGAGCGNPTQLRFLSDSH